MKKNTYSSGLILSIPILLYALIVCVWPAIYGAVLSFKEYRPALGIFTSPSVGIQNFRTLFSTGDFGRVLANTIIIGFGSLIMSAALGLLLAWLISMLGKRARIIVCGALLLLYFIPYAPIVSAIGIRAFANPITFRWITSFIIALRGIGIPVIFGICALSSAEARSDRLAGANIRLTAIRNGLLIYMAAALPFILAPDFELLYLAGSSLTREVSEITGTYMFRYGLAQGMYSVTAAAQLLIFLIQAVLAIPALFVLLKWGKRLLAGGNPAPGLNRIKPFASIAGAGTAFAGVLMLIITPFKDVPNSLNMPSAVADIRRSLFITLVTMIVTVIFAFITTLGLAYPLTASNKVLRIIFMISASFFALYVSGGSYNNIPQFLVFRAMGIVNTIWPGIIVYSISGAGALAVAAIFNARHGDNERSLGLFLSRSWKPALAIAVLQGLRLFGDFSVSAMYVNDQRLRALSSYLMNFSLGSAAQGNLYTALFKLGMFLIIGGVFIAASPLYRKEIFIAQVKK